MPPSSHTPSHLAPRERPRRRRWLPVATLVAAVLVASAGVAVVLTGDASGRDVATTGGTGEPRATSTTRHATTSSSAPPTTAPTTTTSLPAATTAPPSTSLPSTTAAPAPAPAAAPPAATTAGGALCVGDSVMLGASPQHLNTLSMCATVDAETSRQFSRAPAAVAAHAPYPAAVVIHLGNNGTIDRDDVDAVVAQLAGVPRIVLVTVQLNGTRTWESQANGQIWAAAERHANVVVADWKGASDSHPEYTRADGIHLSTAGAGVYAATIAAVL